MFLSCNSDPISPPSLLAGFHGTDFPAFYWYYADHKTAFFLLVPFVSFGFNTVYVTALFFSPYKAAVLTLQDRIVLVWFIPLHHFSFGEVRLSRVPVLPCSAFDVFLDPGRTATTRLFAALVLPQLCEQLRLQHCQTFEAQLTPLTVAVYASCHPLK
jgi:hypothetical protein